jgi:hypothetical protein
MTTTTVKSRVRSFEAFLLRRAYRQDYASGDDAIVSRFAWWVYEDKHFPTFAGPGSTAAYLDYLPDDPPWVRDAFVVARKAWQNELDSTRDTSIVIEAERAATPT